MARRHYWYVGNQKNSAILTYTLAIIVNNTHSAASWSPPRASSAIQRNNSPLAKRNCSPSGGEVKEGGTSDCSRMYRTWRVGTVGGLSISVFKLTVNR